MTLNYCSLISEIKQIKPNLVNLMARGIYPGSCMFKLLLLFCYLTLTSLVHSSASVASGKENVSLRTLTIRQPQLYEAFPSGRDISSFLNYVESYEYHLRKLNLEHNVDSLLQIIRPSHFELQNSQIIYFIVMMKGLASLEARKFLLACLKKSPFHSQVWSTYTKLANMNRVKFVALMAQICRQEEVGLFSSYVHYEILSLFLCALISTVPASVFLIFGFYGCFYLLSFALFYLSYQNFAF